MALELTAFWLQSLILFVFVFQQCSLNLVVNIKAKDGDVVQKNFFADPEKDYVTIDFITNGARYVTVYIDFRLVSKLNIISYDEHFSINSKEFSWKEKKLS